MEVCGLSISMEMALLTWVQTGLARTHTGAGSRAACCCHTSAPFQAGAQVCRRPLTLFCSLIQDVPVEALTTVKPYCNEIHAQAQLWLKRDPKASYEAWKKCLPIRGMSLPSGHSQQPCFLCAVLLSPSPCHLYLAGVDSNGKSPSKSELHRLYLTEKYVWRWKQFLSRRGKRTTPLDLKLGHNNWLRQVSTLHLPFSALLSLLSICSCSCPFKWKFLGTATNRDRSTQSCPLLFVLSASHPIPSEEQTRACVYAPRCLLILRSTVFSLLPAKF